MEQKKNIKYFYYKIDNSLYVLVIVDEDYNELYSRNLSIDQISEILKMFKDKKYALINYNSEDYKGIIKLLFERYNYEKN